MEPAAAEFWVKPERESHCHFLRASQVFGNHTSTLLFFFFFFHEVEMKRRTESKKVRKTDTRRGRKKKD